MCGRCRDAEIRPRPLEESQHALMRDHDALGNPVEPEVNRMCARSVSLLRAAIRVAGRLWTSTAVKAAGGSGVPRRLRVEPAEPTGRRTSVARASAHQKRSGRSRRHNE